MTSFCGILFYSKYGKCRAVHTWNWVIDAEIRAQAGAGPEGSGSQVRAQYCRTSVLGEEATKIEHRKREQVTSST